MKKILVTPRSLTEAGHPALEFLKKAGYELIFSTPGRQPAEEELLRLLPGCIGMIAGVENISAHVLEAAAGLKVISRNGTGVDNIDVKAAETLRIKVLRAEGANAQGVAELTIGFIISLIRSISQNSTQLKAGRWQRTQGIEVKGRALGIIGCGKIGTIVARSALGLGMIVQAFDIVEDPAFAPGPGFRYTSFEEVLADSDIISLHCPLPEDGKPMITAETVSKMKQGVYLINTARSGLIIENALLAGLKNERIAGFATDVHHEEPPRLSDLYQHEKVIVTPHIGGFTAESIENATRLAVENLLRELKNT